MRVIGQSIPTKQVPYRHLGYLASTTLVGIHWPFLVVSVVLLLAGFGMMVGLAGRVVAMPFVRWLSWRRRQWKQLLMAVGMVVLGVATTFLALEVGYAHPEISTEIFAERVLTEVRIHRRDGRTPSADINDYREGGRIKDAWEREMKLVSVDTHDGTMYAIVSAGPDRQFDTRDDLRWYETNVDGER